MLKVALALQIGTAVCVAQSPPAPPTTPAAPLPSGPEYQVARGPSLELALEAAQTAIATCKALGANVAVTVVDSAGVVKIVLASDGTFAKGVVTSTAKAVTAKELNMPISEIAHQLKSDPALADKIKANSRYVVGQGAYPLRVGDEVIGAIGVGGAVGSRNQDDVWPVVHGKDDQCAMAAVNRISARLK
jgi:uncharacterized protein GlcG (DUF336 family)